MKDKYSALTADHIKKLTSLVCKFIHDGSAAENSIIYKYLRNYRPYNGMVAGKSPLVLFPETNEQVSAILKYCNENHIKVFTQGGNSGLVAGSTPDSSGQGIVLSFEKMNKIISDTNALAGTIKLQAGVIIDKLNEALSAHDMFCSIKHGGTGLATIGGSVATNAGGANALKYGVTREQVVGLTVVTADGSIKKLGGNIKDNGLPINPLHLFIGSEGTLGVITEVEIKIHPKPSSFETAMIGLPINNISKFFALARAAFANDIEAFEFMERDIFNISRNNTASSKSITENMGVSEAYILFEVSSSIANDESLKDRFQQFIISNESLIDKDQIALANNETDREKLWALREHCSDSSAQFCNREGVFFDNAVPLDMIAESLIQTKVKLQSAYPAEFKENKIYAYGFGHWGDGNIHYHVVKPASSAGFDIRSQAENIELIVLDYNIKTLKGSYSAEHGNGAKLSRVEQYTDPDILSKLIEIKRIFDPNLILNPGRGIPSLRS